MSWSRVLQWVLNPTRTFVLGGSVILHGVIFLALGLQNYTDHTERVQATVVDREIRTSGRGGSPTTTVWVSYRAEGAEFPRVELDGVETADLYVDDEVTVAYAPEEPEHVVTLASTERGVYAVWVYLGIGLLVAGAAITAGGVGYVRRRRRGNPHVRRNLSWLPPE
ncbi:DUF3592 domain-containing protein [Marinactinospora rubrisoli]|uniref:DUF3592 domain-containing protein n=1 Tax=Marinactinospora rubrisoli TaxID=2715399 RepID=A0ABW2KI11_9ACTN